MHPQPRDHTAPADDQYEDLLGLWSDLESALSVVLARPLQVQEFSAKVQQIDRWLQDLVAHDIDAALYLMFQLATTSTVGYSASHALVCGTLCHILAQELHLPQRERDSLVRAALTMNIAMTALQDVLAEQRERPSTAQQEAIRNHPHESQALLTRLFIKDSLWLDVVGQHHAALQHGDAVGNGGDHLHVVLHHQNRAASRHLFNQLRHAVHIFVAHALGGFVQQHQLRLHGQGGGNFQGAFTAIGQVYRDLIGHGLQAHLGQQLAGPVIELVQAFAAAPKVVAGAQLALQGQAHVLQQSEVGKNRRNLKRANHPPAGNLRWLLLGNVLPIENNAARRGHQKFGQQIKASGFAGPVGPNQRMDGTAAHGQIHVADGGKAFELFGQARCLKNRVTHELEIRQFE